MGLLSSLNTTLQTLLQTTIRNNKIDSSSTSFKRLDVIKIKNRRTFKALAEELQRCTACIVSKNHETSFYIVTETFAVDLAFDRCMAGSLKRSSCAVEHMRASLNRFLNLFDQFIANLFVPGAGRLLTHRDERLLAVVSLSLGVGETSCSQGREYVEEKQS